MTLIEGPWSLRRHVRAAVRKHLASNKAVQRNRYDLGTRLLHSIFCFTSYWGFLAVYLLLAVLTVAAVVLNEEFCARFACPLTRPEILVHTRTGAEFLRALGGYFIGAQVGVLGAISIAVGLVTLIAQRQNANAEVRVYYHESMAIKVMVSSLALLTVLCAQVIWPLEFILHRFGIITGILTTQIILTVIHSMWLLLNLVGVAHFVVVSLSFGQSDARKRYRERYTANQLLPEHLFDTLFGAWFRNLGQLLGLPPFASNQPAVFFGTSVLTRQTEVSQKFDRRKTLYDVRIWLLRLVVRRWHNRALEAAARSQTLNPSDVLAIPISPRSTLEGETIVCSTSGATRLSTLERWLLGRSLRFRNVT